MTERAYTLSEVEALRDACRNKARWCRYTGHEFSHIRRLGGAGLTRLEEIVTVEEMVRTFMLAGTTAEELYESEREENEALKKFRDENRSARTPEEGK